MQYTFTSEEHARSVTRGDRPAVSLAEYFDAYQWLYENAEVVSESEYHYMHKLIADGAILTDENHEELGGVPVRGMHSRQALLEWEEVR